MASLIAIINERKSNTPYVLSAIEIQHLVLTSVKTAIDDVLNAVGNSGLLAPMIGDDLLRKSVDADQLLEEYKQDFTAHVQQYWPSAADQREHAAATLTERQSIGRALRETPDKVDIRDYTLDGMASRRRELDQPGNATVAKIVDGEDGLPAAIKAAGYDIAFDIPAREVAPDAGNADMGNDPSLGKWTGGVKSTEEIEAANFAAFDADAFKRNNDAYNDRAAARAIEMAEDDDRNEAYEDLQSLMDRDRE